MRSVVVVDTTLSGVNNNNYNINNLPDLRNVTIYKNLSTIIHAMSNISLCVYTKLNLKEFESVKNSEFAKRKTIFFGTY